MPFPFHQFWLKRNVFSVSCNRRTPIASVFVCVPDLSKPTNIEPFSEKMRERDH